LQKEGRDGVRFLAPPLCSTLFFVSLSVVLLLTEAYLADKGKSGKRKTSAEEAEETSSDEEDDEEKEAGAEADETMPASASKKKTPNPASASKKKTPKAAPKAPAAPNKKPKAPTAKGDDNVNGLTDDVQASLNLNSWHKIDRSQEFSIFACVFPDLQSQTCYVYI
jgi:hypothetical protein